MIAALGTLAFLATLWLLTVVGAAILEESGAKVAAALKGQLQARPAQHTVYAARIRVRPGLRQPVRAQPRWRDAA